MGLPSKAGAPPRSGKCKQVGEVMRKDCRPQRAGTPVEPHRPNPEQTGGDHVSKPGPPVIAGEQQGCGDDHASAVAKPVAKYRAGAAAKVDFLLDGDQCQTECDVEDVQQAR